MKGSQHRALRHSSSRLERDEEEKEEN